MLDQLHDPAVLPDESLITAITLAELTVRPLFATTDQERAARQAHLQQAESDFDALPVYTCNSDDFAGIDGLDVIAVPVPTR